MSKNFVAVAATVCGAHAEQLLRVEEGSGDELLVPPAVSRHHSLSVHVAADDGHSLVTIPLKLA